MKGVFRVLLLTSSLALAACVGRVSAPDVKCTVFGVVQRANGEPLPNVRIKLSTKPGHSSWIPGKPSFYSAIAQTVTGPSGEFRFEVDGHAVDDLAIIVPGIVRSRSIPGGVSIEGTSVVMRTLSNMAPIVVQVPNDFVPEDENQAAEPGATDNPGDAQ